MGRECAISLAVAVLLLVGGIPPDYAKQAQVPRPSVRSAAILKLQATRQSPDDLELSGDLAGLPLGTTRYITREALLALPQVTYTVTDDPNFSGPTKISGVSLEELTQFLGAAPKSDMVVAICDDKYRANYPHDYVAAHHPLLVLAVNGQPPSAWPKSVDQPHSDMGPYMISHPQFAPSFKVLSHTDEAQIPWGVMRIELRDENTVFGAIAPRGPNAAKASVRAGYRIAQQNCFRCHKMRREGGEKSGIPWLVLSAWAKSSPEHFGAYVRDPKVSNPNAQMPGNPAYDDATIAALAAYFRTFIPEGKP
jgi:mono/diheme cytochrome c family protein